MNIILKPVEWYSIWKKHFIFDPEEEMSSNLLAKDIFPMVNIFTPVQFGSLDE